MATVTLEQVGPENVADCGIGCLVNPRNDGYQRKIAWLRERFVEGLRYVLYGRLLSDHSVSKGRCRNILRSDILKTAG